MDPLPLASLSAELAQLKPVQSIGRVTRVEAGLIHIRGLEAVAHLGDQLNLTRSDGTALLGEVVSLSPSGVFMLPDDAPDGVALGNRVALGDQLMLWPIHTWTGRVIDPMGNSLDGRPLLKGPIAMPLRRPAPAAADRHALGKRLETGMTIFNTMLPIVEGQRLGLFSGSGVGKSSLLGHLASHLEADIVVIALVGERGRELRDFIENVLGREGLKKAVVVAATSDQSPLIRRRCPWSAMTIAEYFRDQGLRVLFLADSITRFAEAHREISVAAGEPATLRGFPASTSHLIMSLCERAGPGVGNAGSITALLSVLVSGSDMEEPIADILRGALDGHIVMDRRIAERGRFPAIDVLRSVSRSLPMAANDHENMLMQHARQLLAAYDESEMMIRAGLYAAGSDPMIDRAITAWPELDGFVGQIETGNITQSFAKLELILKRAGVSLPLRPQSANLRAAQVTEESIPEPHTPP
mgnify:CR=1 FL=1